MSAVNLHRTGKCDPAFAAAAGEHRSFICNYMQFKATCGFGGNFQLLIGTNFAQPLSQWTPLRTNAIANRATNNYSVTLTNAMKPGGQQFYILQSQ